MLFRIFFLLSAVLGGLLWCVTGLWWWLPVGFVLTLVGLLLLAAGFFFFLWWRVDPEKPQDGEDPLYRKTVNLYLESCLPLLRIHVKTQGLEQTPTDRRFLLVCNHTSLIDPVLLLRYFPKSELAFISKQENKDMFVVGKMMHKLQAQLINRENDREALKTILNCIRLLKEDKASVAVFPEGYIHKDKLFHEFRPGVFKIAQKAKVPIVVCTLKNTVNVIPDMCKLRRSDVELRLLTVIPPEEFEGQTTVELAKRIYTLMAEDLGPARVAK